MPIFNFFSLFFFPQYCSTGRFFFFCNGAPLKKRRLRDVHPHFCPQNRTRAQPIVISDLSAWTYCFFLFFVFFFLTRRVWNCTSKSAPRGLDSSLLPSESHSSSINREESTQTLLIVDEERVFFSWFLFDPTDSDIPFDPQNCTSILASHRYSVYDPQNRPRARPIVDTRRELEANQADSIDRQLWARSV